jgi:hypothetical protein
MISLFAAFPFLHQKAAFLFLCRLSMACLYNLTTTMTNYHLTPPAMLPLLAVHEAKEKRRKVLETVRERRKIIYTNFYKRCGCMQTASLIQLPNYDK